MRRHFNFRPGAETSQRYGASRRPIDEDFQMPNLPEALLQQEESPATLQETRHDTDARSSSNL